MTLYLICYVAVLWSPNHARDMGQHRCELLEARSPSDSRIDAYLTQRAYDLGADETPVVSIKRYRRK